MELLFLSVAVLSSVGLSDIVPVTPIARGIVMLESFRRRDVYHAGRLSPDQHVRRPRKG